MVHMKSKMRLRRALRLIIHGILFLTAIALPLSVIIPRIQMYTTPYYSEEIYKNLEHVFNTSQYRQKDNPGIIPDESLFSYVAGAYLRGMDPIMANSEHTPLGKYFLAGSIYLFRNEKTIMLLFALLSGISIWWLAKRVLGDGTLALIPLVLVAFDRLFMNQLVTVPLLDIIQLPFIYFALAAFLRERKTNGFFWTALCIGLVMATKTVVPGLLLIFCIGIFLALKREYKTLMYFLCWLPVAAAIFILTYTRTFMSGYTFWDFLKFQKWIFLYQKSKLIYPFSSLRLLLFNQWQTWWGAFSVVPANDWSVLWPISTISSFLMGVWMLGKKRWQSAQFEPILLIILWVMVLHIFLSVGVVSSRFFIPLLPAQYILLVYAVTRLPWKKINPRLFLILGLTMLALYFSTGSVRAEYVLPYPSFLPGNKLYSVSRRIDLMKAPFYFGDFGGFKYHLNLSDKYLVEAKTLFEYKQYLLGSDALRRSDEAFVRVLPFLVSAQRHNKDVSAFKGIIIDATRTHIFVLTRLKGDVPYTFTWTPEKADKSVLLLHDMLFHSMRIRERAASESALL